MPHYYEISLDKFGMQAVTLQYEALVKIAKIYKEKYGIEIFVGAGGDDETDCFRSRFETMK